MDGEFHEGVLFGARLRVRLEYDPTFLQTFRQEYDGVQSIVDVPDTLKTGADFAQYLKYLQLMQYTADHGDTFIKGVIEGLKEDAGEAAVSAHIGPNINGTTSVQDDEVFDIGNITNVLDPLGFGELLTDAASTVLPGIGDIDTSSPSSSSSLSATPSSSTPSTTVRKKFTGLPPGAMLSSDLIYEYAYLDPYNRRAYERLHRVAARDDATITYKNLLIDRLYHAFVMFRPTASISEDLYIAYIRLLRKHTHSYLECTGNETFVKMNDHKEPRKIIDQMFYVNGTDTLDLSSEKLIGKFYSANLLPLIRAIVREVPELRVLKLTVSETSPDVLKTLFYICAMAPSLTEVEVTFNLSTGGLPQENIDKYADHLNDFTRNLGHAVRLSQQVRTLKLVFLTELMFGPQNPRMLTFFDANALIPRSSGDPLHPYPQITALYINHSAIDPSGFFAAFFAERPQEWSVNSLHGNFNLQQLLELGALKAFEGQLRFLTAYMPLITPAIIDWFEHSGLVAFSANLVQVVNLIGEEGVDPPTGLQSMLGYTPQSMRMLEFHLIDALPFPIAEFPPEKKPRLPLDNYVQVFSCRDVYGKKEIFPELAEGARNQLQHFLPTNRSLISMLFLAMEDVRPSVRRLRLGDDVGASRGGSRHHGSVPSPAKAKEMLANPPHGHSTPKQRRYFEALAHGWRPTRK